MSERKIPDVGTVIQALRCVSSPDTDCRTDCPYLCHETEEDVCRLAACLGCEPGDIPFGELDSCNVDLIGLDAADLLEQLNGIVGGADNGL